MTVEAITSSEAAKRIGVKPHTLRCWRMSGRGPRYVRLGGPRGRVVYDAAEVLRWLAARTYGSTSEESMAAIEAEAGR